ncbi:phage tail protein [Methylomonas sp. HYX-M1]|uniref:phage tail protein n=1 Tax=Methylomonas sp. HYX-M1 TaxID=3139307 RepID=UPI00345B8015
MALINISLIDDGVQRTLDALPNTIFNAQRSAISTTTTWAGKELRNRMRVKTGIPARVFRRFRVKTKRNRETGTVWIGLNKVKATYLGAESTDKETGAKSYKLVQTKRGARAGKFFFEGGFVATMRSGHAGIFKRLNESRLPIVEQYVDLDLGFEVAEDVARAAQIELRNRFAAKVRELNPGID